MIILHKGGNRSADLRGLSAFVICSNTIEGHCLSSIKSFVYLFPRPDHLGQSTVVLVMIQTTTNSGRAGHGAGSCAGLEGAFGRTGGVAAAMSAAAVVVGVAEAVAVGSADGDEDQMTATGVVLRVLSGD